MRFLILSLATLLAYPVGARSPYQLFQAGAVYLYENPYYQRGYNSQHLTIRTDSTGCFEQPAAVKPGFWAWLQNQEPCFQARPSFLGRQICQLEERTIFSGLRNDLNDTLVHQLEIYQQAPVGSQWFTGTRSNFSFTDSIYALVVDVRWETVFGLTDSIKYLHLYEGSIATGFVVGSLRFGRSIGLLESPDLNYPEGLTYFVLRGIYNRGGSPLSGGIPFPTAADIYAQEIGDERHLLETETYRIGNDYYLEDIRRRQYLHEQWRDDTYLWQVWDSQDQIYQYGDRPLRSDTTYCRLLDTTRIDLAFWPAGPVAVGSVYPVWEDELPTQAEWTWEQEAAPYFCNQLRLTRLPSFLGTEACISPPSDHSDPNPWYYNRFGGPYYSFLYDTYGVTSRKLLSYYRTVAGDVCGVPYDFVVHTEDLMPLASELQLYPNPTADILYWTLPTNLNASRTVQLLNAQGQVLGEQPLTNEQWDVHALPPGTYWLRRRTADQHNHLHSFIKN